MKTRWIVFFVTLVVTLPIAGAQALDRIGQAHSASTDATELGAIVALERRDAEAAKSNDVETLVSLWTEDGVLLLPRQQAVVGIAAIRQVLEQQRQQSAQISTLAYDEDWKERRIVGDEASEWGEINVTLRLPNGKEVTQTVHSIRILQREKDGSWKVARAIVTPAGAHPY